MTLNVSIICYSLTNGAIIIGFITCEVLVFLSNEYMFFNVSRERTIERKDILRRNRRNCIVLLNYNYLITIIFYFGLLFSIYFFKLFFGEFFILNVTFS